MKPTDTLLLAIIGHLVGDFLLQNDWLSTGKKKSTGICMVHCVIWTLAVMTFAGWHVPSIPKSQLIFGALLTTHFIQDRWDLIPRWMRFIGQNQFMQCDKVEIEKTPRGDLTDCAFSVKPGLGPWSIIIVDQVWHLVVLWAVWRFVV